MKASGPPNPRSRRRHRESPRCVNDAIFQHGQPYCRFSLLLSTRAGRKNPGRGVQNHAGYGGGYGAVAQADPDEAPEAALRWMMVCEGKTWTVARGDAEPLSPGRVPVERA